MTPDTIGSMSKGTKRRTIRIEDSLWDAALVEAEIRGESLPEAIRKFLMHYTNGSKP